MLRALVVARYASTRAGLRAILTDSPEFEVVGEASGREDAESIIDSANPDVLLLDATPPDGFRAAALGNAREIPVVVLGDDRDGFRNMSRSTRGWGYLLRDAQPEEIIAALRAAVAGLVALDHSLASSLPESAPLRGESMTQGDDALTDRERDVLQLVAGGLANKTIAAKLQISQHTVKFHVASILAKLGAGSRTEAVSIGARLGLVSF